MRNALRIIDANANRAREALRVMEDAARFGLDDEPLCGRLKALRHGLAAALDAVPGVDAALAWRDTQGDVGTGVRGAGEYTRVGTRGVALAAGKRLSEALRSIEEYAKTLGEEGARAAAAFEALRYRGYDAERDLALALGAAHHADAGAATGWRLCVILTESLCARPWLEVAREAVRGGADMLQLREKALESRELLARARALVALAREAHECEHAAERPSNAVTVIINDRPDIALLSGAQGVHLGQTDLTVRDARRIVGVDLLVGVSTENLEQARAARRDGADYCGVGPMFPTSTKDKPRLAGPAYLRDYLAESPHLPPCLAIGGVTAERMAELRGAGASAGAPGGGPVGGFGRRWGAAVSFAVCASKEPRRVCEAVIAAGEG